MASDCCNLGVYIASCFLEMSYSDTLRGYVICHFG